MSRKGHSEKCKDLETYWNLNTSKCDLCSTRPGYEVTPNCGFDDDGGSHEPGFKPCKADTFNDGSGAYCKPCTKCALGQVTVTSCNTTTDTHCFSPGSRTTAVPVTTPRTTPHVLTRNGIEAQIAEEITQTVSPVAWAVPLAIVISIMLAALLAFIVNMKRRRGQRTPIIFGRRSSYANPGFSSFSAPAGGHDLEDILNHSILSAPIQTVLDNLDVLEDLVILLDPESPGIKNTKHLASLCSFPATWVTYTYSMKESKSPLKALLEAVTSKNPDWTVSHLAKLLRQMERNDAIAVLAKLRPNEIGV